jgi:hypothetical protein
MLFGLVLHVVGHVGIGLYIFIGLAFMCPSVNLVPAAAAKHVSIIFSTHLIEPVFAHLVYLLCPYIHPSFHPFYSIKASICFGNYETHITSHITYRCGLVFMA